MSANKIHLEIMVTPDQHKRIKERTTLEAKFAVLDAWNSSPEAEVLAPYDPQPIRFVWLPGNRMSLIVVYEGALSEADQTKLALVSDFSDDGGKARLSMLLRGCNLLDDSWTGR